LLLNPLIFARIVNEFPLIVFLLLVVDLDRRRFVLAGYADDAGTEHHAWSHVHRHIG
jgi:hypothetical protein